ncbi:MAG: hypothetical protein ACOCWI_05300, partial [Bacillota bacterium]
MLLPMLMGQNGDNSKLIQTILAANGGGGKEDKSSMADIMSGMVNNNKGDSKGGMDMQMMSMLASMMNSNKADKKNDDFTKGGNSQLISMLMSMMNSNNQTNEKKEIKEADISAIKEVAGGDIVKKMAMVINNRNKNS